MPEYELIQQRNISGKGLLKVPTDVRKNRAYILYASVLRKPKNQYLNFNYNPPRSRYGTLVFLRDGYVVNTEPIEFEKQVYDGVNDISGQTLLAVKCAYDGILQTFVNLSIALAATPGGQGLTPISVTNLIADYTNLRLAWDECRLQCYADTAIQLNLYRLVYDVCNEDFNADIPSPVPEPFVPIPPGEAIEGIDPAYDEENDDGNTVPYPGDGLLVPDNVPGAWLLTWTTSNGGQASATYQGMTNDTWAIVAGASTTCNLIGNSALVRNGSEIVEDQFNCNPSGFVSTLVSAVFTPAGG